jgi:hypothetical protein
MTDGPSRARAHSPWMLRALLTFVVWAGLLGLALATEHTRFGHWLFEDRTGGVVYLVAQLLLALAALGASAMTFIRGPTRHRLIVIVPTAIVVIYGLVAIAGP